MSRHYTSPPRKTSDEAAQNRWCEVLRTRIDSQDIEMKSLREEMGALMKRVQFLEEVNDAKDGELRDQIRQLLAMMEPQVAGHDGTDGTSEQGIDVQDWNLMDIPDHNLLPTVLTGLKETLRSQPPQTYGQALWQGFETP
ncbi:hypothetical protein KFL_013350020 [Klebsormidium nitens]|uniref:Uncharacterized protein n=1 Tax=Klebsormidium nitens TaxID=105231 RepID=A0A1Y1IQH3_KLENI|nr:hypothetical protein KFL_013350020 [Klebsormidium nitens]|eukprot:GAQ93165.1 hypothetical protein KFL_013350020 [Klebsormidium nitens]